MVSDQQPHHVLGGETDEPKQTKNEGNEIGHCRIARYNRRDQRLQVLSELEQRQYHGLQRLQQEQQGTAAVDALSDCVYVVNGAIAPETTRVIIKSLGTVLHDVPFTIVGCAALIHHGRDRHVSRITLVCPGDCVRTIYHRAQAHGMYRFHGDWHDSFGYQSPDGSLYRVRVRAVHSAPFSKIRTSCAGDDDNRAQVMPLASMVTEYARLYAAAVRRSASRDQGLIGGDIMWMLRRIAALGPRGAGGGDSSDGAFTLDEAPWILTRGFWEPFICSHPEAVELFRVAGAFPCVAGQTGAECVACLDQKRPRPGDLVRRRDHLPRLRAWTDLEEPPLPMPCLQSSRAARVVSVREAASTASSRVASPACDSATFVSAVERVSMATIITAVDVGQVDRWQSQTSEGH
ncbi:hypothetical protein CCM_00130 [Cordyceps militaris CM01]|uniref:Uncharacterized protein n=2 Tax=Cordyceps militaris TaxID=73501 RepID=G3J7L0_CORMM|nr:uncharacterized protein CCM_00130 [Cordyceps militaris CM01]ATY63462.1 hypothetical protein A9K55_007474 [Cordyceps militaris]EGX95476.1 hypothetical protein CCM_00130 [Cordyceps militaris CM01]